MPYITVSGQGGSNGSTGDNKYESVNVDTYTNGRPSKLYGACVGAGGGGGPRGGGSSNGGGGGGGGLSDGTIDLLKDDTIQIKGGGGGKGSTATGSSTRPGGDGRSSYVSCGGGSFSAGGGEGGRTNPGGDGGDGNVRNGEDGDDEDRGSDGGGAAGFDGRAGSSNGVGGGGASWDTSGSKLDTNLSGAASGANGITGGGGGCGRRDGNYNFLPGGGVEVTGAASPGGGGGGIAFAGWPTLETEDDKRYLRSGEPIDIDYEDSLNNTGTVEWDGYDNNTSDVEDVTYTFTDENGAEAEYYFKVLPKVNITYSYANPNPVLSNAGIPTYSTHLFFEGVSIYSADLQRRDGGVWETIEEFPEQDGDPSKEGLQFVLSQQYQGGIDHIVDDLRQSTAGNTNLSPRETRYRLVATDGYNTVALGPDKPSIIYVDAYNDDFAADPGIADLLNREPNEDVLINFVLSEVDMPTRISCTNCFVQDPVTLSYTTTALYTNGSVVNIKVVTLPFNNDENGLVNEMTCTIDIGRTQVEFMSQTRAPVVEEIFDFGDNKQSIPYPQGPDGALETYTGGQTAIPHLQSPTVIYPGTEIENWDVELENPWGVQIRAADIKRQNKGDPRDSFTNLPGNDTELEVNNQRFGDTPNNTWTKPNISNM